MKLLQQLDMVLKVEAKHDYLEHFLAMKDIYDRILLPNVSLFVCKRDLCCILLHWGSHVPCFNQVY